MADGVAAVADGVNVRPAQAPTLSRWLFGTRNGWLTLWAVAALLALTVPLAVLVIATDLTVTEDGRWYLVAASTLIVLPIVLFALDPEDSVASGPRLLMPTITIAILAGLTFFAVGDKLNGHQWLADTPRRVAFIAFLMLAIAPRVWNAALFAYHRARNRRAAEKTARAQSEGIDSAEAAQRVQEEIQEYRNSESIGAVLATLVILAIVGGAAFIGTFQSEPRLGTSVGVGIFILVVCLFASIVFLDWISRFPPLRAVARSMNRLAPRMRYLADFYDWIDTGLVRIGSHVAGADHLKTRSRYTILGSTLLLLAIMAWHLPAPLGFIPICIGLIVALSLSRLWSWVEEDRNMAAATQFHPLAPQRVGFREDFRDETLLGFIFVLILLPIAMMQSNVATGSAFFQSGNAPLSQATQDNFLLWLGYTGFELAKALPIVDWADIYKVGGDIGIEPTFPAGMHAVFMGRVLVDLILVAALLQAIGIANRNSQQKALFALGRVTRLDELVEKAALARAVRLSRISSNPLKFDLTRLLRPDLVDFTRYDMARLRQVHATSASDPELRAFIAQIFEAKRKPLDPAIVVAQNIAATHRNEIELFRTFEQAKSEHRAGIHPIDLHDIEVLLLHLRRQSGLKDFKQQLIHVAEYELAAPPEALLKVLSEIGVGERDERDIHKYVARMAADAVVRILPKVKDPQSVADALALARRNGPETFGSATAALAILIDELEKRLQQVRPRAA